MPLDVAMFGEAIGFQDKIAVPLLGLVTVKKMEEIVSFGEA